MVSLGLLDEGEAWNLFKTKAILNEDDADGETIKVAMEVAKECKGLPIAIVTLARALKDTKIVRGWEIALNKIKSSRLMEIGSIEEEKKNAYVCLEISYNYLKKDTTKRCFLLCALYPEDRSIEVEELVKYAWGLEFYRNAKSIEDVRFEVVEAIDCLKDSCLLLEDGKGYIKMHDVVRDVALWIASKEDKGLVTKTEIGLENENFKEKLEILLFDFDTIIPIKCLEGMQQLKVLSLKIGSSWKGSFFSLNALKSLTSLRALQLNGRYEQLTMEGISALANLAKLEILILFGFKFKEPMDTLGELKNLKMLDLRNCEFFLAFPNDLIQRLVQLEELYLDESISNAILPELSFFPRLTSLSLELPSPKFPEGFVFPRLERYIINIMGSIRTYPRGDIFSRTLIISMDLQLKVFQNLLPNVEILQLDSINKIKEIKWLSDGSPGNMSVATVLRNLQHLAIYLCENLQVIFQMEKAENHQVMLSKLKDLSLWCLPDLEYIWKMPNQCLSFGSLETIRICECGKLKSLFTFSLAQSLVCLGKLVLQSCHKLEQIVEELGGDEQEISPNMNLDQFLCLPKLRYLKIRRCDNLEFIFPNLMATQGLPQLKKLRMNYLPRLKQIRKPAKESVESGIQLPQHQLLPSLTDLRVSYCPEFSDTVVHLKPVQAYLEGIRFSKLKVTIRDINAKENFQIDEVKEHQPRVLSNLRELDLQELPELRWICKGPAHYFSLQSLKDVLIWGCRKLKSLFSLTLIQSLQQLEQLYIQDCEELKTLFEELENDGETESNSRLRPMCLPSLKRMSIRACERLENVLPITLAQGLTQLEALEVVYCPQVRQVFGVAKEHDEDVDHCINLPHLNRLELICFQ